MPQRHFLTLLAKSLCLAGFCAAQMMASSPTLAQAAPASLQSAVQPIQSTPPRMLPLEITVNGAASGSWVLMERSGVLYAPADAFEEWRVNRRANAEPVMHQGQTWYALTAVPGFSAQLNMANQSLELKFSPSAFAATRLTQTLAQRPKLSPSVLAGFVNYDISYTRGNSPGLAATQDLGALMEFGVSNDWGVLTSTYSARNLISNDPLIQRNVRRLETTFTRDLTGDNLTMRLGDSSTRSGAWGRSVFFGGFQISRNFGLTPGFISQPFPIVRGLSSAPSTVELYINDALRQTSQVPTGPFAIDNFPLLTGNGQARVVVRDVLGRETVLVQDFFSHASLLEEDLSDWSFEAGAVRRNLGTRNADYGQRFASGIWRYGINKGMTVETRGEYGQSTQGGGIGLVYALPFGMLGQGAVATSRDASAGRGQQWLVGIENASLRHGFSLRSEGASRGYRQIGQDTNTLPYRQQFSGNYTYSSERYGAVGVGYARINSYDQGPLTTYSANYAISIGQRSSLSLNAVRVTGRDGQANSTSVGLSLLVPLENNISLSSSVTRRNGQVDAYVSASQTASGDTGLGWRTLAGQRATQNYAEGGLYYQGSKGLLTADVNASANQQTVRLGAQGGLVGIDGQFFATRRVQESFALVEVPGYADVGVGFQGNILARTDKDGKALVPRLLPYQPNNIRLDPSELPISAELDSIEQVVVPGNRSGLIVKFPVRSGRGALIKIVFDDGEPAPAGAQIELVGDKQEFFVARRGEAFVTGLQTTNQIRLTFKDARCTLDVVLPPGALDDIARVGPLTCTGIKR
ncbi:MAG: fimbria/pilus outer membrane usher protein [Polaromonas sp.]